MKSTLKFDSYKIINHSYRILIGSKSNNELSESLGISYSDLNIIFGLWFIYSIHFMIRIGTLNYSDLQLFVDPNSFKKNLNFSLEKDYLFKIYYLRGLAINNEYTLESIIDFVNKHRNINNFNNLKFDKNNNFEIEEILKKNARLVIKYLSSSFIPNKPIADLLTRYCNSSRVFLLLLS